MISVILMSTLLLTYLYGTSQLTTKCVTVFYITLHRLKEVYPLVFDNNFGMCGLIFKILSPIDSQENSLCIQFFIHHTHFHLTCTFYGLLPHLSNDLVSSAKVKTMQSDQFCHSLSVSSIPAKVISCVHGNLAL